MFIAAFAAIAVPAISSRCLDRHTFGAYALVITTNQFFLFALVNWLFCAIIRFAPELPRPLRLSTRLAVLAALSGSLAAVSVYITMSLFSRDAGLSTSSLILMSTLTLAMTAVQTIQAVLRANEQAVAYTLNKSLAAAVPVVAMLLAMLWGTLTLENILFFHILGAVLASAFTIGCFQDRVSAPAKPLVQGAEIDSQLVRRMLAYGVSLSATLLLDWVLNMSDRHIIGALQGLAATGLFSAPYTYADQLVILPLAAIQLAFSAQNSRIWYDQGANAALRMYAFQLNLVVGSILPVALVVSLFPHLILQALGSGAYLEAFGVMRWVAFANVLLAYQWVLQQPLVMTERWFSVLRAYAIAAMLKLIAAPILLLTAGLEGPAIAKLISYAVLTMLIYRETRAADIKWHFRWRTHVACLVVTASLAAALGRQPSNDVGKCISVAALATIVALTQVLILGLIPRRLMRILPVGMGGWTRPPAVGMSEGSPSLTQCNQS